MPYYELATAYSLVQSCCYVCQPVPEGQIRTDVGQIASCAVGKWPLRVGGNITCFELTVEQLDPTSPWTAMAIAMASLGMIVASAMLIFSVHYYEHPVIRSSGRELAVIFWIGVMVNHSLTFLLIFTEPSSFSCALLRLYAL
jgi:hypothetical protein